jgi:hypothetical protein
MPWVGFDETGVTQLTSTEWYFSLGARREVQIGIRSALPKAGRLAYFSYRRLTKPLASICRGIL